MNEQQGGDPAAPVTYEKVVLTEVGVTADIASKQVSRIYTNILAAAVRLAEDSLQDQYTYAAAIATAGAAAEVAVGVTLGIIVAQKKLGGDAEARLAEIREYNLRAERVLVTWNEFTGDTVQNTDWWPRFVEHVKRRNKVLHSGLIDGHPVTHEEACKSLGAVRELIDYVNRVQVKSGSE